jgi:hypothetical protein
MVWRASDLVHMDPKTQAARIAHTVGESKRVQILDHAKKANIRVLNPGLKKEAEVAPEVAAEPTAPTEPTAEATKEAPPTAVEVTEPGTEVKEPETTEEPAKKKRRASKGSKEKSRK